MASTINDAIEALRGLPPERAEEIAAFVLDAAVMERSGLSLLAEQQAIVEKRLAEPLALASDDEVEAFFAQYGR